MAFTSSGTKGHFTGGTYYVKDSDYQKAVPKTGTPAPGSVMKQGSIQSSTAAMFEQRPTYTYSQRVSASRTGGTHYVKDVLWQPEVSSHGAKNYVRFEAIAGKGRTTPRIGRPTQKLLGHAIDKDALRSAYALKRGTGNVNKMERWATDATKSRKVTRVLKKGAAWSLKGMSRFGVAGLGFAGVMGLTLALSKTRHGREQ